MFSLQFWKSWSKPYQFTFLIFSFLIFAAIIFFWTSWSASPSPVITYDHFQQIQRVEVQSHSFQVGLVNLIVPADSYVIFENIFGSKLQPNVFALYFFIIALTISFLFFISIISTLSRYWFLIGMGLAMLFLASLRFEALVFFGVANKTITIIVVLLFGGLAFYFNSFRKETAFIQRLLIFLMLIVAIAAISFFFGRTASPFLHLAVNGLVAGII